MRTVLAALLLVLGLAGCSSSDGSDSTGAEKPAAKKAPKCTPVPAKRLTSFAESARKGVTIESGFSRPAKVSTTLPFDDYVAFALRISKGGQTHDVVLAAGEKFGDGLVLATKDALPYFTWGAGAKDGSPVGKIRDDVADSDAAKEALACLG